MTPKAHRISVAELANEIRTRYRADPTAAEGQLEAYLETRLEGLAPTEKLALIDELRSLFAPSPAERPRGKGKGESDVLARFCSLLLGQKIDAADLGSTDLVQRLADALNSIFDQLNELVGIINTTFAEEASALETIRHIIGSDLGSEKPSGSLAGYLGQIKDAFLIANQAARLAASVEIGKILAELDPERLTSDTEKGLRFGFMRKGELVEAYREKYGQIRKWFEGEPFPEDYAREFEKACQRLHSEKGRAR